jgi:hypothetical protein
MRSFTFPVPFLPAVMNSIPPQSILDWLGAPRAARLKEQAGEAAFNSRLEGVARTAPDAPTGGIWLLQHCGVKPSHQDLQRWSGDVAKLRDKAAKKPATKKTA